MSTRLGTLGFLYFETAHLIDKGYSEPIDDAADAMLDGETMEFLDQYEEVDFSGFNADQRDAINELFANKCVYDAHRLGIDDNGLGLIAANVVALFTNQTFREPDTGTEIEPNELTVVEDW